MTKKIAQPKPGEPIRLRLTQSGQPRYYAQVDVSLPGEPRRQKNKTFVTLTEARAFVQSVRADRGRGVQIEPRRMTVDELLTEYLRACEKGDQGGKRGKPVRPSTLNGYRATVKRISATLGGVPLANLTYQRVTAARDEWADSGQSIKTVRDALGLLRSALNYAKRHNYIPSTTLNPAEGVSAKGVPRVEREPYTVDEMAALAGAAEGHPLAGVFGLVLLGLRRGEVLGVFWEDIEDDVLTVRRSRVWQAGGFVDGPPKTSNGQRPVRLDAHTLEMLRTTRRATAERLLALGVPLAEADPVAMGEDGDPLRPEHLATEWRRLCRSAGVKDRGLHAARHGAVTVLRAAGVPDPTIARRLGHDEVVMKTVYDHGVKDEQNQAAAFYEWMLRRKPV